MLFMFKQHLTPRVTNISQPTSRWSPNGPTTLACRKGSLMYRLRLDTLRRRSRSTRRHFEAVVHEELIATEAVGKKAFLLNNLGPADLFTLPHSVCTQCNRGQCFNGAFSTNDFFQLCVLSLLRAWGATHRACVSSEVGEVTWR
jgi:hypothetical protein